MHTNSGAGREPRPDRRSRAVTPLRTVDYSGAPTAKIRRTAMQAFVAMRFSSDPWRDKPYQVIKTELENAGYVCQRSDELKTSGPVVDEVCRLLTDADLVVIDSSGDSHSVSYEIGFCHGSGRPHDRTLLIHDNDDLPFNYRHYRHRVYRDLRHLRRLIRGYLALNEPLGLDEYGYSFSFPMSDDGGFGYIREGAHLIFNCLSSIQFSGRCECYAGEIFWLRRFVVGVMLRPTRGEDTLAGLLASDLFAIGQGDAQGRPNILFRSSIQRTRREACHARASASLWHSRV